MPRCALLAGAALPCSLDSALARQHSARATVCASPSGGLVRCCMLWFQRCAVCAMADAAGTTVHAVRTVSVVHTEDARSGHIKCDTLIPYKFTVYRCEDRLKRCVSKVYVRKIRTGGVGCHGRKIVDHSTCWSRTSPPALGHKSCVVVQVVAALIARVKTCSDF